MQKIIFPKSTIVALAFTALCIIACDQQNKEGHNDGGVENDAADMDSGLHDASIDDASDGSNDSGGCKWRIDNEYQNYLYSLNRIWGLGPNDIYAVGGEGTPAGDVGIIYHYDGKEWRRMEIAEMPVLKGIWGTSDSDLFAIGLQGAIYHYDGNQWTRSFQTESQTDLVNIWGSNGSDVYVISSTKRSDGTVVVERGGEIIHFDGTNWDIEIDGKGVWELMNVWGSSQTDVYVVGIGKTGGGKYNKHFNGTDWEDVDISQTCYDVWGTGANDVYLICTSVAIEHFDGNSWSENDVDIPGVIERITGNSKDEIYLLSYMFDDSANIMGSSVYHNGQTGWSKTDSNESWIMNALWADNNNQAFALGYVKDTPTGLILRYSCQ